MSASGTLRAAALATLPLGAAALLDYIDARTTGGILLTLAAMTVLYVAGHVPRD